MGRHSPVSLVADEKRGSTITLQAVNELIRSLESAGELSIREQKFLKLAKAFKQLEAENVQIKAMNDCLSEELRGYESDGAFERSMQDALLVVGRNPRHRSHRSRD